jgi:DNA-binding Lrp family transcriptional regulator
MIENWWDEVDRTILECLRDGGPMTPAELGRRAGMSEGEATAFLATLIREGRVRLQLVEVNGPRTNPWRARSEESGRRVHVASGAVEGQRS